MPLKPSSNWCERWVLLVFGISSLFMMVFSVGAIQGWPSWLKRSSILLFGLLPPLLLFLARWKFLCYKRIPVKILWLLVLAVLGLIASLKSENQINSLKAWVLFMVTGPMVFVVTSFLFQGRETAKKGLKYVSYTCLGLCFFGIIEYAFWGRMHLFSGNPLPAATLLLLILPAPLILWSEGSREARRKLGWLACFMVSVLLIVLVGKKGPVLALIVSMLPIIVLGPGKRGMVTAGMILLLVGTLLVSRETLNRYVSSFKIESSIALRAENYFFMIHLLKDRPLWGVGYKPDPVVIQRYLDSYQTRFYDTKNFEEYWKYFHANKTFENIVLAFIAECGLLFSAVYFGGVICWVVYSIRGYGDSGGMPSEIFYVVVFLGGFGLLSMTFDTLRFPNLNWVFHSWLGYLVASKARKIYGSVREDVLPLESSGG